MRIPLPGMMRHWREREFERHLSPSSVRHGLGVWAFFARRPRLYQLATSVAMHVLGYYGRKSGRFQAIPGASGWTDWRDFPAPEGQTFQRRWKRERKAR
jgi:L-lactate dehydrogenase complex protein LldF